MATYQFVFELLPGKWLNFEKNNLDSLYEDELHDSSIAWRQYQPEIKNLNEILSKILPKGTSWNKDLSLWGSTDHHDIQIWHQNNKIESIAIRIDLRDENSNDLILSIINLANILDCKLFFPHLRLVIDAKLEVINQMIATSNAARFVSNPRKYLDTKD